MRKLFPPDLRAIVRLRTQGVSWAEIIKTYHCSISGIFRAMKHYGIKLPKGIRGTRSAAEQLVLVADCPFCHGTGRVELSAPMSSLRPSTQPQNTPVPSNMSS